MGQSSIEIGIFAVGTGRWELDNDDPDVKRKNIQLAVGFGATACYEYSWTISYPIGPVPAYVCFAIGVTAGVSIQFTVDFCWSNGGFGSFKEILHNMGGSLTDDFQPSAACKFLDLPPVSLLNLQATPD